MKTPPRRPMPDLQEVLSRARAMDPDAVEADWGDPRRNDDDAESSVEDYEMPSDAELNAALEPDFADFLSGAKRHLDGLAETRALSVIPTPAPRAQRRAWWIGAAAALLLTSTAAWWMTRGAQGDATTARQAVYTDESRPELGVGLAPDDEALTTGAGKHEASESPESDDALAPSGDEAAEASSDDARAEADEGATPAAPSEKPEPEAESKAKPKPKAKAAPRASLEDLDAQAQALWRAGDLDGASKAFREIIKRAPRSKRAELAYGDLFSLTEQRGSQRELDRLWRDYLKRFPQGRYSDDTRARICRREATSKRAACWADYLRTHPSGAHVGEARKSSPDQP